MSRRVVRTVLSTIQYSRHSGIVLLILFGLGCANRGEPQQADVPGEVSPGDPNTDEPESLASGLGGKPREKAAPLVPPETWPWLTDTEFAEKRETAIRAIGPGTIQIVKNAEAWWDLPSVFSVRSPPPEWDAYGRTPLVAAIRFSVGYAPGAPAEEAGVKIPDGVEEVVSVRRDVDDEFLGRTLPYLPDCKLLQLMFTTNVTDAGVAHVVHLPYLERLDLNYGWPHRYPVRITDDGLKPIGRHPSLRWVFLQGIPITDRGMRYLAESDSIERLSVYSCPVTSECFLWLATMPKLRDVSIGWNTARVVPEWYRPDFAKPISKNVAKAIESMDGRLNSLRFSGLDVHPSFLEAIAKVSSLTWYEGPPLPVPPDSAAETRVPPDRKAQPR
ncbi:MAG: hypothetical protein U1E05_21055 [Patescibacteria group bacterium]|nr:hypothetical protein [Patescibacteria group bacterium]